MDGALLDDVEGGAEPLLVLGSAHHQPHRARERGDGGQRVVELVREGADGPFPDVHLLAPQLGGEPLDQGEVVPPAVQLEDPAGHVEDLLLALLIEREERVPAARQSLPQPLGALGEDLSEGPPLVAAAGEEQLAGGAVDEDDAVPGVGQHDGGGGRLEDRLEEHLALDQGAPLVAQHVPHGVVELDQLAQLVAAIHGQVEAEVVVPVSLDPVAQRSQDPRGGQEHPVEEPPPHRQPEADRHQQDRPRGGEPIGGHHAEGDDRGQGRQEGEADAGGETEGLHPPGRLTRLPGDVDDRPLRGPVPRLAEGVDLSGPLPVIGELHAVLPLDQRHGTAER
jgi:hypothetical protein